MQSKLAELSDPGSNGKASIKIDDCNNVIMIKPSPSMALQAKPGTCLLELIRLDEADINQQWVQLKDACGSFQLQNVATGLFLDVDVKFASLEQGEPWEHAGSELSLKA